MVKQYKNSRRIWASVLCLGVIFGLFVGLYIHAHRNDESPQEATEYSEYEFATVTDILSDNCESDETSQGAYRGEQLLIVEVTTGQYKGKTLMAENFVGPIYGGAVELGDSVCLIISTYANGDLRASVYEYNRSIPSYLLVGLFVLVVILVGGKTGAKSVLGLAMTVVVLLTILIPLLMKGWPTVLTTFLLSALIAVACFILLGGVDKKTICACLGTVAGMALAMLFGLMAQGLLRLDGLRAADAEALLQLRQTGTPVGIRGLLIAGVIVAAMGAVMDVAMSISSAMSELKAVSPELTRRDLWHSGMNIGRDMVGTMTDTLILAFLGSGFVEIMYLSSMGLSYNQLITSSYMGTELISGLSSAIGVVLSVPVTALVCSLAYGSRKAD